jgi:hypothetical protein
MRRLGFAGKPQNNEILSAWMGLHRGILREAKFLRPAKRCTQAWMRAARFGYT